MARDYLGGIDELIAQTTPQAVAAHLGVALPARDRGELRMPCVFCDHKDSSYGTLTVNLDDPGRRIFAHCCGVRGNLLTLIHGLLTHRPPTGGRLRGDEFKRSVAVLREFHGLVAVPKSANQSNKTAEQSPPEPPTDEPSHNVPLKDSPNERARGLVELHKQLVVDVEQMSPAAAAYFRKRPWLTPEVARHWRLGYLPQDAKGLLRGRIVYAFVDEHDDVLSYFGRDPAYEAKRDEVQRRGSPADAEITKHRFVKGFHRGLELYGQNGRARLAAPRLRESLARLGMAVVEGPNDVIRLDLLGVAAVGLCSNKATDVQVAKIARFAREVAGGRVLLLPDNDPEGEEGCRDLLWQLAQQEGITPRLGWSSRMFGGAFAGRQPESLSLEEWETLHRRLEFL